MDQEGGSDMSDSSGPGLPGAGGIDACLKAACEFARAMPWKIIGISAAAVSASLMIFGFLWLLNDTLNIISLSKFKTEQIISSSRSAIGNRIAQECTLLDKDRIYSCIINIVDDIQQNNHDIISDNETISQAILDELSLLVSIIGATLTFVGLIFVVKTLKVAINTIRIENPPRLIASRLRINMQPSVDNLEREGHLYLINT